MSRPSHQRHMNLKSLWLLYALRALSALLIVVLVGDAVLSWGGDFNVYWRAVYRMLRGGPVYAALIDENQPFKYPPFIATLLAPLGLFARETLDAPWRLLQVACLLWIARDLKRDLKSEVSLHIVLLTFWGIWVFNIVTGQITLLMMAGAWVAVTVGKRAPLFWSWWGLSTKILGILAWFAMPSWWRTKSVLIQAAAALAVSAVLTVPTLLYAHCDWALYWSDLTGSIFSPSAALDGGRNGLSALWAEVLFGAGPQSHGLHLIGSGISIALMFFLFWWARPMRTPAMTDRMRWAWATALVASIHPLAFAYVFAWAFPLGAYAVDFAWERWSRMRSRAAWVYLAMTLAGVVSVALLQRVPLLPSGAIPGSRAIGVWMIAIAFAAQHRQRHGARSR